MKQRTAGILMTCALAVPALVALNASSALADELAPPDAATVDSSQGQLSLHVDGAPIDTDGHSEESPTISTEVDGQPAVVHATTTNADDTSGAALQPTLASVSTSSYIALSWDIPRAEDSSVSIYRDGELIGVTDTSSWIDENALPGKLHEYQVDAILAEGAPPLIPADATLTEEEGVALEDQEGELAGQQYEPEFLPPSTPEDVVDEFPTGTMSPTDADGRPITLGTSATLLAVGATADQGAAALNAITSGLGSSTFRYNTFIPSAKASWLPCTFEEVRGGYFSGDNRGWGADGSSRTRVTITAPWMISTSLQVSKSVSNTRLYNASGQLVATRNAGTNGIGVYTYFKGDQYTAFRVNHTVGNPFCAGGAIAYNMDVHMSKFNDYQIDGNHRKSPSHEIYMRHNNMAIWYGIYGFTTNGFQCLVADIACGGRAFIYREGRAIP